jgi:hypothetical protein
LTKSQVILALLPPANQLPLVNIKAELYIGLPDCCIPLAILIKLAINFGDITITSEDSDDVG